MKIAAILGTRPEIIKMSPIIRELERRQADYFVLHTGQHYSYDLDRVFFEQLGLAPARYNLGVGSGSHAEQTARILIGVEEVLQRESAGMVLVEGDTNSVLAGALAAVKLQVEVGHVEAGLRSYDRQMPEETNRVLTDHCSDYLFAPTHKARGNLLREGIPEGKIFVTGNTIVDATYQNLAIARESENGLSALGVNPKEYLLTTIHRQENVDDPVRFASILEGLNAAATEFGLPVVYPVHPRSRKRMSEFGLEPGSVMLIDPVDSLGFLKLEYQARAILTDSGGVQEEACILGVPCVTLRDNTERPETIDVGSNILAGASSSRLLECLEIMLSRQNNWANPFGDGRAAERIAAIIIGGEHG